MKFVIYSKILGYVYTTTLVATRLYMDFCNQHINSAKRFNLKSARKALKHRTLLRQNFTIIAIDDRKNRKSP